MIIPKLPIVFAVTLGFTSLIDLPTLGQVQSSSLVSQDASTLPDPPPTPPDNDPVAGGGLNGSSQSCQSTNQTLTALIPVQNPVLTISDYPTFWFYLPYAAEDIEFIQFSVNIRDEKTGQEKTRLYQASFQLPGTPGIVGISLSSVPKYALEEGRFYHWYFKVYCKGNTSYQSDWDVNGWVQRVPATPENERKIEAANPDIWYDALTHVAKRRLANPQDPNLKEDWTSLLEFIDRKELDQVQLIDPIVLPEPTD